MTDNINPDHYKDSEIECIDEIEASMCQEAFKVYLNGSLSASGTLASSYVGSGNNCRIAGPIIEGGVYHDELHARIAQVFCYERVITAAEVLQNYNATKSTYGY